MDALAPSATPSFGRGSMWPGPAGAEVEREAAARAPPGSCRERRTSKESARTRSPAPASTRQQVAGGVHAPRGRASRGPGWASRGSCPGWPRRSCAGRRGGTSAGLSPRGRSRRRAGSRAGQSVRQNVLAVRALELAGVAAEAGHVAQRSLQAAPGLVHQQVDHRAQVARAPRTRAIWRSAPVSPEAAQARRKSHLRPACRGRPPRRPRSRASRGSAPAWAPRACRREVDHLPVEPPLERAELVLLDHRALVARGCPGCYSKQAVELAPPGPARAPRWRSSPRRGEGMSQMRNSRVLK